MYVCHIRRDVERVRDWLRPCSIVRMFGKRVRINEDEYSGMTIRATLDFAVLHLHMPLAGQSDQDWQAGTPRQDLAHLERLMLS